MSGAPENDSTSVGPGNFVFGESLLSGKDTLS